MRKPPSPLAVQVGTNIAMLRKKQGLSQPKLAALMGIETNSVCRIEKGLIEPRFDRLQRLAECLNCEVADFFVDAPCPDDSPAITAFRYVRSMPGQNQQLSVEILKTIFRSGSTSQGD